MQNQQMAAMAGMAANVGGPDGTPMMGHLPRPGTKEPQDMSVLMNTYIYDYFMRNNNYQLARSMIQSDLKMNLQQNTKQSPGSRNVNGVDSMDTEDKEGLPLPVLPSSQPVENSFLLDWWCQFWDIFSASRNRANAASQKGIQYSQHVRNMAQLQNDQRAQRMLMNNNPGAMYQNMMRMPNGIGGANNPNNLKRTAAMNSHNPGGAGPMNSMNSMNKQAMISAQMQRDGSGMDLNGQRPQSPGSTENAPSPNPNKRPRVEGNYSSSPRMDVARPQSMPQHPNRAPYAGQANHTFHAGAMNAGNMAANQFADFGQPGQNVQQKSIEVYAQSLVQQQRMALNNHAMGQAMNPGVQGSPMNQQGLDGHQDMFAGNQPRTGMPNAPGQQPQGNHALQDYQMQLMLLEQQNKKRLLMARQEQDNMSAGPHNQPPGVAPGFPPAMSPNRAGPSPNPTEQLKRTPKLNQQGLPGSPMPDPSMANRGSPAPGMSFDPNQMPPGMPPQFPGYNQMPQTPMMRPPSSHPGSFNPGQQLTPQQQMEALRAQSGGVMPNGVWRGPGPQGMMPGQGPQMGGPMNPQQRNQMPPPPAPPAGEQPRTQEPSPSQPAQAPPTPSQTNKANPKKKQTKDPKKATKAKGAGTGATPAASTEDPAPTPTPSTPITPQHKLSFTQNGQPNQASQPQPPTAQQPQPLADNTSATPFGDITDNSDFGFNLDSFGGGDALENFDFDSFLHVEDSGYSLGNEFNLGDEVQAGGDI